MVCCLVTVASAQQALMVSNVVPLLEVDSVGMQQPVNLSTQSFCVKSCIELSDSISVDKIYVKAGRQANTADVVNVTVLATTNNSNLPTGIQAIERRGNKVILNFGNHTNVYTLHYEVWAEDKNGVLTTVYQTRQN
jgi:hypothetical protein